MPRVNERIVYPAQELDPFLNPGMDEAITELCIYLNKFEFDGDGNFDPPTYAKIPDLITDEGLEMLGSLPVPINGKCPEEALLAHPVAGPLAVTMGEISRSNMDLRSAVSGVVYSLKNETGVDFVLNTHRDLLDGHAVLYNYGVTGQLFYILDGSRHELRNNELVVLHGAAIWGDITSFLPGHENDDPHNTLRSLGGVTIPHAVVGEGPTSRNRLLVYANGRDTNVTQIAPELPFWF